MRTFSFFTVILLCIGILTVDILAFYWLQSITRLISSALLIQIIHIVFWVFTVGLISSILILKAKLDAINPMRKQRLISAFYGLAVSSFVPKLIFVIIISILYFSNYVFSEKESVIILPLVGLLSGVFPFIVIVYGIFKSAYRFKTYHHKLKFKSLPLIFDGLRIVHISDLHLGSFNYRYTIGENAVKIINNLEPDIIVITGDLINNFSWELRGWEHVFTNLFANKGKFAVLGNHDYGDYSTWDTPEEKLKNVNEVKQFYKNIGFKLLLNEGLSIKDGDSEIAMIGVENWGKPPFKQYGDLNKAIQNSLNVPFKILLSHDPSHWSEDVIRNTNIDLTLSGHTHGMQAGIQFKTMQWSPIKYKYKHWAGIYNSNDQYLYVNRGLGWLGFPGRLGMRPEITCIDLKTNH